ncbi:hypothetical protein ACIRRA_45350 [Nocardia sp. NPDC101769]
MFALFGGVWCQAAHRLPDHAPIDGNLLTTYEVLTDVEGRIGIPAR